MANVYDININFSRNKVNGTVSNLSNKRAVAQFIYNLLDTQTIELPYKEWQGSGLSGLLGEACSNITASVIAEQIRSLITKYIKYIELQDVTYIIDPDNQKYIFTIYYTFINDTEIIEQTLELSTTV